MPEPRRRRLSLAGEVLRDRTAGARSRVATRLFVVGVGALLQLACSEQRPPPAGSTTSGTPGASGAPAVRDGGSSLYPVDAGAPDDAAAERCAACASESCASAQAACATDAVCAACFSEVTPSCFANAAFGSVMDCTCRSCGAACDLSCTGVACLRCAYAQCRTELESCTGSTSCQTCPTKSPAPSCGSDPLAAALFTCACARCETAGCDTACP